MYGEKAKVIFDVMIKRGYLPNDGSFEVTKKLIDISHEIGNEMFAVNGRKQKPSDLRFRKRIAGLTLMELKAERDGYKEIISVKPARRKDVCGFVYIIKNDCYPNHFKIGITSNVERRLATYQTYDPNRSFYVDKKYFVENTRIVENNLLNAFSNYDKHNGEWVEIAKYDTVVKYLDSIMM